MVSLWILLILSVLVIGAAYRARMQLKLIGYLIDEVQLQETAVSGLNLAQWVLGQDTNQYDALNEEWANMSRYLRDFSLSRGSLEIGSANEQGKVPGLLDEERKINLNTASPEIIANLPGFNREIAQNLVAYRDSKRSDGSNPSRSVNIEFMDELSMVKGIDESMIVQLNRFATVYGSGQVNINTAPNEVLKALGLNEMLMEKILRYRKGVDDQEGTPDDRNFDDSATIVEQLRKYDTLSDQEVGQIDFLRSRNLLTVNSAFFAVVLTSKLHGSEKRVDAVIEKKRGKVVFWHEN